MGLQHVLQHLDQADAFIVLLTPASYNRSWLWFEMVPCGRGEREVNVITDDGPVSDRSEGYLYWRVWQALTLIWERNGERHVPHLDPRDFRHGLKVLRSLDLVHVGEICYANLLGRELFDRWPVQPGEYSVED